MRPKLNIATEGLALLWELQQRKGKFPGLSRRLKSFEPFAEAKHEEREPKQPSYPGLKRLAESATAWPRTWSSKPFWDRSPWCS